MNSKFLFATTLGLALASSWAVADEGTTRAAVVAEVEPVGRGRSGDSRARQSRGLRSGWSSLTGVRLQRRGARRAPLRECAI